MRPEGPFSAAPIVASTTVTTCRTADLALRSQPVLDEEITMQVETIDRDPPVTAATAGTTREPVIVRGSASAVLCWLLGRASAATADLEVTRRGQAWRLPRLRAWA